MKKILVLMLVLSMILLLTGCATVNADGGETIAGVAIREGILIVGALTLMLIDVGGAWLLQKIGKGIELGNQHVSLENLRIATEALIDATRVTVGELQQTVVEAMKIESGGKLTEEQIQELKYMVKLKTLQKLDEPTKQLLEAAGKDIGTLIAGAAEDWVLMLKP